MNGHPEHIFPLPEPPPRLSVVRSVPPRSRRELLPRDRLLRPILDSPDARGFVLTAPAGFGKTTLLRQWVAHLDTAVAWVTLNDTCHDPRIFLDQLATEIGRDRSMPATFVAVAADGITDPRRTSEALLSDLSADRQPLSIVIDDFHACQCPSVHAFVQRLLDQLPQHVRLMISSRMEPDLHLARHRVLGTVVSLTADDLRFSDEEAHEFLERLHGDVLSKVVRDAVVASVDGWPAGLQMAALAIAGRSISEATSVLDRFSGHDDLVSDFLMEEVFDQQSDAMREFLLATSLCDRFCVDLGVALTGASDTQALLDQAWRGGLFLSRANDDQVWYRYHLLFREFLRKTVVQTYPLDVIAAIQLRASDWFAEHGLPDEAIRHTLAAGAWERVIALAKPVLIPMFLTDRAMEVRDWLERLPREFVHRDPDLCFMLAYALARLGYPDAASRTIALAEAGWAAAGIAEGVAAGAMARGAIARGSEDGADMVWQARQNLTAMRDINGDADDASDEMPVRMHTYQRTALAGSSNVASAVQLGTGLRMLGKPADATAVLDDVLRFCNEHGRDTTGSIARVERVAAMVQQGQLRQAADLARHVSSQRDATSPSEQRHALLWLGEILREWNLLGAAEEALLRAAAISQRIGFRTMLPRIRIALARTYWAMGRFDDAMSQLNVAIDSGHDVESEQAVLDALAIRARFNLTLGNLDGALAWLLDAGVSAQDEPDFRRLTEHLTLSRVLIARDEPSQAVRLLDRLLEAALADNRTGHRIELLVVKALALQDLRELDAAVETLASALDLGQSAGYARVFLDEGMPMRHLLRTALSRDVAPSAVIALLRQLTTELQQHEASQQPLVDPLTQREIDVLRLIAVGLANKEIADELYISVSTVKRHITNLYGKLGATTRTEAVEQSYQLGIL